MNPSEFDDYDDLPRSGDPPVLQPLSPEELSREELRARYLKPGFGFWMAIAWVHIYMVVMQLLAGLACGVPIMIAAMAIEAAQGGQAPNPEQWMKSSNGAFAILLTLLCSHLVGWLFGWLMLRWQVGKQWKRVIALSRTPSLTHVVLVLIGFPAMLALSAAIEQPINRWVPSIQDILNQFNIQFEFPGINEMLESFKKAPLALLLLTIAVLPAFNEEFWCRGFLANGLSRRYSTWATVAIVSVLFGYMHLEPKQGLGAALLGVVIHASYLATRSLWVPIAIHFANNGMAVIHISDQANFPVLKPLEEVLNASPVLFVAGSAALFGAVCYALYQTRCKLAPIEPGMPTWEPKGVSSMELPPANTGTIVAHDAISPLSVVLVLVGAIVFSLMMAFA